MCTAHRRACTSPRICMPSCSLPLHSGGTPVDAGPWCPACCQVVLARREGAAASDVSHSPPRPRRRMSYQTSAAAQRSSQQGAARRLSRGLRWVVYWGRRGIGRLHMHIPPVPIPRTRSMSQLSRVHVLVCSCACNCVPLQRDAHTIFQCRGCGCGNVWRRVGPEATRTPGAPS